MTRTTTGFTLLEVLVSVAILGVSLVAIFSSTVGAVRAGYESTRIATSSLLARCTMGEVEERTAREGLPAVDASGDDECCEGHSPPGYRCRWEVTPVVLPDDMGGEDDEEGGLGGPSLTDVAETGDVSELLEAGTEGDIISEMALNIAFPLLKPAIEDQVRRATVSVWWGEDTHGDSDECDLEDPCMSVVQFLVAEPGSSSTEEEDG